MEEFRNKMNKSFRNGVFGTKDNEEKYLKGLEEIEKEHRYFFEDRTDGKNKIENYVVPNNFTGRPYLGLNYESEMPKKLKSDLIELWESIFSSNEK